MPAARRKVGSGSALRRPATGRHTKLNQDRRGPSAAHALLVGAATLSMAALSLLAQSPPPQPPSSQPGAQSVPAPGQPSGGRGGRRGAGPGVQDNTGADFSLCFCRSEWKQAALFVLRLLDLCRVVLATNCL